MADPFAAQRLRTMDALRRDAGLTSSSRLVGLEIYAHLNRNTGTAWPSEERLAKLLGLNVRTVRRAVAELVERGWLRVTPIGRHNEYTPVFIEEKDRGTPSYRHTVGVPDEDKLVSERGHFRQEIEDKKYPLTPKKEFHKEICVGQQACHTEAQSSPAITKEGRRRKTFTQRATETPTAKNIRSLAKRSQLGECGSTRDGQHARTASRVIDGNPPWSSLRERRGDERYEHAIAARLGSNGYEILSILNQIDEGRPRLNLIRLARDGVLKDSHLAEARLLALSKTGIDQGAQGL